MHVAGYSEGLCNASKVLSLVLPLQKEYQAGNAIYLQVNIKFHGFENLAVVNLALYYYIYFVTFENCSRAIGIPTGYGLEDIGGSSSSSGKVKYLHISTKFRQDLRPTDSGVLCLGGKAAGA
jgi:hypothetical protein